MKLTLARDVTLTDIESGAVLLDGRHGRYWQLNHSGAGVLRQLLDGEAPDAAAAGLCAAAPVSDDQARQGRPGTHRRRSARPSSWRWPR
ncbi:lasso peptide biosynthesis PqqD family chaperone [Streptomyces sp. L7]